MENAPTQDKFYFKKSLGQNFIYDKNLLDAIALDAEVKAGDTVLEIGAGAGTLTKALAKPAGKVISVEVDTRLKPQLLKNLQGLGNVTIIYQDILKLSTQEIKRLTGGTSFKVVANLPYYITTPVLFHFLESNLDISSLTVMVQKEVAQRMTASPSTKDYGALTLAINARAEAKITRIVHRNMFTPPPKVDSAVVRMDIQRPYDSFWSWVIKGLFSFRRKTVLNNIVAAFSLSKAEGETALNKAGIPLNQRSENLALAQVKQLSQIIKPLITK